MNSVNLRFRGKVWKFGDNINTDEIIPARYLDTTDPTKLALHCMEPIMPNFANKISQGDIIVAGANFGCGSSREHAPIAIKACGISCVIAKSFARIFFRNAINIGLPILECPDAVSEVSDGSLLEIDLSTGKINDLVTGKVYQATPFPPFLQAIISAGGLMNYIKEKKLPRG